MDIKAKSSLPIIKHHDAKALASFVQVLCISL
jgi:hypothetical protein